jgi:chromosome segregation ATPase
MQEAAAIDNKDDPVSGPEIAETEQVIREEKEHLERAMNEPSLLRRKLDLDTHMVYSNPNNSSMKAGNAKLRAEQSQIAQKQDEIQQAEQKIADLEEHLQDLKLNSAHEKIEVTADAASSTLGTQEKGETYWRKRFAEIRTKIRMAQSELDVLRRELNEALVI